VTHAKCSFDGNHEVLGVKDTDRQDFVDDVGVPRLLRSSVCVPLREKKKGDAHGFETSHLTV
jgi:hypothetical protein